MWLIGLVQVFQLDTTLATYMSLTYPSYQPGNGDQQLNMESKLRVISGDSSYHWEVKDELKRRLKKSEVQPGFEPATQDPAGSDF